MKHSGFGKKLFVMGVTMVWAISLPGPVLKLAGQESATSTEAAENGKKVYLSVGCRRCHGLSGEGGTEGPPLVPDPKPLREFMQYVRSPKGEMPAFSPADLDDSDLEDIYAFILTLAN